MVDGRQFENRYIAISQRKKSSDFHEILYTAADFELDERHVIKNEKVALDRLRVRQNVFIVFHKFVSEGRIVCTIRQFVLQVGPSAILYTVITVCWLSVRLKYKNYFSCFEVLIY